MKLKRALRALFRNISFFEQRYRKYGVISWKKSETLFLNNTKRKGMTEIKGKKFICLGLAIVLAAGSSMGCAKKKEEEKDTSEYTTAQKPEESKKEESDKETTEQTTKESTEEFTKENTETTVKNPVPQISKEQIASYSNDVVTWGPGVQMADDGRPVACVAFQEQYSSLGADFLKENEKVIYLTFDEGYENGYSDKILDVLKEKDVSAVFFVTMPYVREQDAIMKRLVAEGHVIGSHSVTHPSGGMPSLSIEEQIGEYQELHDFVKNTYQYEMYLFRPPAGIFSEQSLAVASHCGYRSVMWSFAYADWDPDKQPSHEEALNKMKGRLHNGAIYLLHAVSATNTAVLGEFIDYARSQGYEFKKYEK